MDKVSDPSPAEDADYDKEGMDGGGQSWRLISSSTDERGWKVESTGNGELEISLKKLLDQSERAVLASEDTDRLSTEVPPDEEYLKLFQEEKNVRKCIILLLAKWSKKVMGKWEFFWGNEAICWGNEATCWGDEAIFWGNEANLMGKWSKIMGKWSKIWWGDAP